MDLLILGGTSFVGREPGELAELVRRTAKVGGAEVTVTQGEAEEAPLVLPPDGSSDWLFNFDPAPATAAGLRNRPIEETIADTLDWDRTRS